MRKVAVRRSDVSHKISHLDFEPQLLRSKLSRFHSLRIADYLNVSSLSLLFNLPLFLPLYATRTQKPIEKHGEIRL